MPKCPRCNQELTPAQIASLMGQLTSEAKAEASRNNGAKNDGSKSTGRPPGAKDKAKRKTPFRFTKDPGKHPNNKAA